MKSFDMYLVAKDGYYFNYYEESENKDMLKRYNRLLKSMKAIKPIGNLNNDTELHLFSDLSKPCYRFAPKNQDAIKSFMDTLESEHIRLPFDLEMGHIYFFYFSDDFCNFNISIYDKEDLDRDIIMLQEFSSLLEKGGKYESSC